MTDPFDLSQYRTSFTAADDYRPQTFAFAGFPSIFAMLSEQIKMRQAAVHLAFGVPAEQFVNVELFDLSTPSSIAAAVELFQDAIRQFVSGSMIETYGKLLSGCSLYMGFFSFTVNGLPIVGIENVLADGNFSAAPDPSIVTNRLQFALDIGENLNEIILALNALNYIHGPMVFAYPFDDTCEIDIDSSTGSSVNSSIGSSANSSVNSSINSSVNSSFESSVGTSFGSSVGSSANSSPGSSPGASAGSSAGSSDGSSANSSFLSSANSSNLSSPDSSADSSNQSSEASSAGSDISSTEGEETSQFSSAGSVYGSVGEA